MKKKTKKRISRSIALFLGLLSWYSIIQISISNLIENAFNNFLVSAVLILVGVILIGYSITPTN